MLLMTAETTGWGDPDTQSHAQSGFEGRDFDASITPDPVFDRLTPAQCEAVSITQGPLLVLAAAGSGKTTVITRRIANILAQGVPPWSVLALTFTNKAAGEMRDRVFKLLPPSGDGIPGQGMTVTTFHSFGARMLRRYAEQVGLQSDYTIYDTADQKSAMKETLARLNLSKENFPPDRVLNKISAAKNELKTPATVLAEASDFLSRNSAKCYEVYQGILKANNAVDFDDLLLNVATLLRDNEEVRQQLQRRFRYLLIDEYQDTNHAQLVIAQMLTNPTERNICVVGDPDQSIYGWRGADIANILEFQEHYPDTQVVKLGENFRSTAPILAAADHLIKHNKRRQDKPLYTSKEGGDKPLVKNCLDEHHEARTVVEYFQELHTEQEIPYRDMAVFYRTNALSRVLEAEFRRAGVPYVIVRGTAFFQRKEIKDALAYLRLVLNPYDEVNLRRVMNKPARGISDQTVKKIEFWAIDHHLRLFDACKRIHELPGLTKRATNAVLNFVKQIEAWRALAYIPRADVLAQTAELPEFVKQILRESGMEAYYKKGKTEEDEERLANLDEFVNSAAEFEDELMELLALAAVGEEGEIGEVEAASDEPENELVEVEFDPFADPFGPLGDLALTPGDDLLGSASAPTFIEAEDEQAAASDAVEEPAMDDLFAAVRLQAVQTANSAEEPTDELTDPIADIPITGGCCTLLAKLRAYLERVTLVADADAVDSDSGAVMMMTFHAAKGLEFPAVAIVGLEEGLLPHNMSRDTADGIEEERRLFFVGITRAEEKLLITRAQSRAVRGYREATIASQFLHELPEEAVQFDGDVFSSESIPVYDINEDAPGMGKSYKPAWQTKKKKAAIDPTAAPKRDATEQHVRPKESAKYPVGCRVNHPQFGQGKVESVARTGSDIRLRIKFDHVGTKTMIERYARLQRIK